MLSTASPRPAASVIKRQAHRTTFSRPKVCGKFLHLDDGRFFAKGVAYGSFPPNRAGSEFPEPADVAKDVALMRNAGINTILTYTVPPLSLLDQAEENGLRVIVTVPWMEYVCFLEDKRIRREIRHQVRQGVASCRRHPAVLLYCVGKEIPPDVVRWHGPKRVQAFLQDLCSVAKDEDPEGLVTYTNFPTTEYLELPFVDVCTFNVYLHRRRDFCAYLSRLQHLAGEIPLVLTEFGMCSLRHGREAQASFLDWQIQEVFDHDRGCRLRGPLQAGSRARGGVLRRPEGDSPRVGARTGIVGAPPASSVDA